MKQDIGAMIASVRANIDPETLHRVNKEIDEDFAVLRIAIDLRDARRAANLTQAQLAATTGITQSEISRIEKGRYSPRLATLFTLARALKKDFVIQGTEDEASRVA
jgi:DNA-binding XRE family transcriptional regulator